MLPIFDSGGYAARSREFKVAELTIPELELMQDASVPLGMTAIQWRAFRDELWDALSQHGLHDADARIRGSTTRFFCGVHKPFPKSSAALLSQATPLESLSPGDLLDRWVRFGYQDQRPVEIPNNHYFDGRMCLGLVRHRSDYDVQICSDNLAIILREYQCKHPSEQVVSSHGGHFKHVFLAKLFEQLDHWSMRWAVRLDRDVNMAGFATGGPADGLGDDRWVIRQSVAGPIGSQS
jgi:hypothetical protein